MTRSLEEIVALREAVVQQLGSNEATEERAVDVLNHVPATDLSRSLLDTFYHRKNTRTKVADLLADLDDLMNKSQESPVEIAEAAVAEPQAAPPAEVTAPEPKARKRKRVFMSW